MSEKCESCGAPDAIWRTEIADLRAIVEALPLTADKVRIIPGRDVVYHPSRLAEGELQLVFGPDACDDSRPGEWLAMSEWAISVGGLSISYPLASECYSTRAAAQAAEKKSSSADSPSLGSWGPECQVPEVGDKAIFPAEGEKEIEAKWRDEVIKAREVRDKADEEVRRLRAELHKCADEAWPDHGEFASFEASRIYRDYVRRWGALGLLDYETIASRLMREVPCDEVPWLYEGIAAGCGDELHDKLVDRLRREAAEAAENPT